MLHPLLDDDAHHLAPQPVLGQVDLPPPDALAEDVVPEGLLPAEPLHLADVHEGGDAGALPPLGGDRALGQDVLLRKMDIQHTLMRKCPVTENAEVLHD